MSKQELASNEEIFEAISEAQKSYQDLTELIDLTEDIDCFTSLTYQDYSNRNLSHPLGIAIKG